MLNKQALVLTATVIATATLLTACGAEYSSKTTTSSFTTPTGGGNSDGKTTPTPTPKDTRDIAYDFQELTAAEKKDFFREIQGVWISTFPGWGISKDEEGKETYTKEGFEVNGRDYGSILFKRARMSSEETFDTRTYADFTINEARVSRPNQNEGYYKGFQIIEAKMKDGGFRIIAVKRKGDKLKLAGYNYRWASSPSPEAEYWAGNPAVRELKPLN